MSEAGVNHGLELEAAKMGPAMPEDQKLNGAKRGGARGIQIR